MDFKFPCLTGYQVISLLLLTLIGLFLGVVSFASFGVLNVTQEPIDLLKTALDNQDTQILKLDAAIQKLEHLDEQDEKENAAQTQWRDTVMNDHLFIASILSAHDKQNQDFARQLNLTSNDTNIPQINGTDLVYNNDTKVPIPPSALKFFQEQIIPSSFNIPFKTMIHR